MGDGRVQIAVDLAPELNVGFAAELNVGLAEGEGELGGIEHLDCQTAPDLHLTGVVGGVGAQAR